MPIMEGPDLLKSLAKSHKLEKPNFSKMLESNISAKIRNESSGNKLDQN